LLVIFTGSYAQSVADDEGLRKFQEAALYYLLNKSAERGLYIGATWVTADGKGSGPILLITREPQKLNGRSFSTFEFYVTADCKTGQVIPRLQLVGDLNDRLVRVTDAPNLDAEQRRLIDRDVAALACALSSDFRVNWEIAKKTRGEPVAFGTLKGFTPGESMELIRRNYTLRDCKKAAKGSRVMNGLDGKVIVASGSREDCFVEEPLSRYPALFTFAGRDVDSISLLSCDGKLSGVSLLFDSSSERMERIFQAFLSESHFPTTVFVSTVGKPTSRLGTWSQITWEFSDWSRAQLNSQMVVEGAQHLTTFFARQHDCLEAVPPGSDLR